MWRSNKKLLFKFHDGDRWRKVDPLEKVLALHNHPVLRLDVHPDLMDEGDDEATQVVVSAMREVFGLAPYDESTGKGTPMAEVLTVFNAFGEYLDSLKKNTRSLPTAPPSTAATSKSSKPATTSATSPSGSTAPAPNCAAPTSSASE